MKISCLNPIAAVGMQLFTDAYEKVDDFAASDAALVRSASVHELELPDQLLAIARAAIADPPVLILDEATSSIDTRTEKLVQQGMDALMKGRTNFVIAHRLSTVRNSDCIIVLEQGHIIERGTHDELIAQKGKYYQLYTGNAVAQ